MNAHEKGITEMNIKLRVFYDIRCLNSWLKWNTRCDLWVGWVRQQNRPLNIPPWEIDRIVYVECVWIIYVSVVVMLIFYDLLNEQPFKAIFGVLKSISFHLIYSKWFSYFGRAHTFTTYILRNDVLIVGISTEFINFHFKKVEFKFSEIILGGCS